MWHNIMCQVTPEQWKDRGSYNDGPGDPRAVEGPRKLQPWCSFVVEEVRPMSTSNGSPDRCTMLFYFDKTAGVYVAGRLRVPPNIVQDPLSHSVRVLAARGARRSGVSVRPAVVHARLTSPAPPCRSRTVYFTPFTHA